MPVIDYKMRDTLHYLRDNGRLNVLIALILRANIRNRCWPSMSRLCADTGYSISVVNEAKKWLVKHKAIEVVPFKQRAGKECDLPPRQTVYQLTGTLVIDDKTYPYLYHNEPDVSESEISEAEILAAEILESENEVVKVVKSVESGKSVKKKKDTTYVAADAPTSVTPSTTNSKAPEPQSQGASSSKPKATRAQDVDGAVIPTPLSPVAPAPSLRAPRKKSTTARIIDDAWGKGVSGYLLPMLMGTAKPERGEYHAYRLDGKQFNAGEDADDRPMTEAEIYAFGKWWRDIYPQVSSPEKPAAVWKAVIGFRSDNRYETYLAAADYDVRKIYHGQRAADEQPTPAEPIASSEAHNAAFARVKHIFGVEL